MLTDIKQHPANKEPFCFGGQRLRFVHLWKLGTKSKAGMKRGPHKRLLNESTTSYLPVSFSLLDSFTFPTHFHCT